jgi:hypothetical protein
MFGDPLYAVVGEASGLTGVTTGLDWADRQRKKEKREYSPG